MPPLPPQRTVTKSVTPPSPSPSGNGPPTPYWSAPGVTLYHGDCREVLAVLPDRSVDFVFTDPPYGHNNNNGDLIHNREKALGERRKSDLIGNWERAPGRAPSAASQAAPSRPIANDGPEANELFRQALPHLNRLLASGGCCCCCCCCGGGGPDPQFARWSLWLDEAIGFKQMIIFDKGPMGMGWHYRRSYETVLVAEKRGGPCRWFDETKKVENIIRPGFRGIRKIIPDRWQHPTEKPPELAAWFIHLHSRPNHVVLDPFLGSGSTLLAAVKGGRRFIGIDVDEEHLKTSIDRYRNWEGGGVTMGLRRQLQRRGRYQGRVKP